MDNFELAKHAFLKGLNLFESKQYADAESHFLQSLELIPDRLSTLNNLAATQVKLAKFDAARDSAHKAIALDGGSAESWQMLASIESECHNYEMAVKYFDRAIEAMPEKMEAKVGRGIALSRLGRHEAALAQFEQILDVDQDQVDGWLNMGIALSSLGRGTEALVAYDHVIRLNPECERGWFNKGNTLDKLKFPEEAIKAMERAIGLKPDYVEAWLNKGNILGELNRIEEAVAAYHEAIRIKPDYVDAWLNLGATYQDNAQYLAAQSAYSKVLALDPENAAAHYSTGNALRLQNRFTEAIPHLELAIRYQHPETEKIEFLLGSMKDIASPKTAPEAYVSELFDKYADKFDEHLQNELKYRAFDILYDLIKDSMEPPIRALDIGCGTGLMGERIKPHASLLVGVDISGRMLAQAAQKKIYDALHLSELTQYLQDCKDTFDLVAAADVFVYIGDLSAIFSQVHRVLEVGGCFCFTVEALDKGDYLLGTNLRYRHSLDYCTELAKAHHFQIRSVKEHVIRYEGNHAVHGYYLVMGRG